MPDCSMPSELLHLILAQRTIHQGHLKSYWTLKYTNGCFLTSLFIPVQG